MSSGEWFAWGLAMALLGTAGVACRLRARVVHRDRELLHVALMLELLLGTDLAAMALKQLVLGPARAAGLVPYAGFTRLAFHGTQLAFLAWPFGALWLAWRLFGRSRFVPLAIAVAWGLAAVLFARAYPGLRGDELASAYRTVQAGCVLLALASLLSVRSNGFQAGRAHLACLLLVAGAAAELAGPYLAAPFTSWWTAQASWIVALAAVVLAAAWSRPWGPTRAW